MPIVAVSDRMMSTSRMMMAHSVASCLTFKIELRDIFDDEVPAHRQVLEFRMVSDHLFPDLLDEKIVSLFRDGDAMEVFGH